MGNLVLRRRASRAVKRDFRTYIRRYTSPNAQFEYGYHHSNALLQFLLKFERCKPRNTAPHPAKYDVINDVKLFPAVYCRIYCRKFLMLSNQKSRYKSKYIRIFNTFSRLKLTYIFFYIFQDLIKPTVSHICSLICLPSIDIIRAPNSTPMVKSWTGWNLLSVNCRSRHDFPTPTTYNNSTILSGL